ncbi:MAG: LysE family transporter [Dehalococcoidia bacterium]|nr:LysE family transporter [Dehalococcoidia bacterium]
MLELLQLGIMSFGIGISGAVSPGPLTIVTMQQSIKKGFFVGPAMAIGHSALEIFVVLMIALGLVNFAQNNQSVENIIGLIGGAVLLFMGKGLLTLKKDKTLTAIIEPTSSLLNKNLASNSLQWLQLGWLSIVISITNPYFVIWWLTIGAKIINDGLESGVLGVTSVYFGHILADFVWLLFLSVIFSSGKNWINDRVQILINRFFGMSLILFGIYFIYNPIIFYLT